MTSGYSPRGKSRNRVGHFKIGKNRVAWANTFITKIALMRYSEEDMATIEQTIPGDQGEQGDTLRLMISTTSGRPYTLNITAMTEEELEAFEGIITLALRMARPIILDRDREAKERYANGDDSYSRSYRQLPQFIIRQGSFGPDDQSLFVGFEHALAGPESERDIPRTVRADGPGLADEVSQDSSTQDDRATANESEGLG